MGFGGVKVQIPDYLVDQVRQGRVVLVLGAGASKGATNSTGDEPPSGAELAKLLNDTFLGGSHPGSSLQAIGELAISESDLITVQNFIRSKFLGFSPADFHQLLPTFNWRGLATTNYDQIIEDTYECQAKKSQTIVPFRGNLDRVDDLLRSSDSVPLLKLHGCISRSQDPLLPFILTPDQYITHRKGRSRLFDMLKEWGYEYPVVFIGQGLSDPDLRDIILELSALGEVRPAYYMVAPNLLDTEIRLWDTKRIRVIKGTYSDFLRKLDKLIPVQNRVLTSVVSINNPIESKFTSTSGMSEDCSEFLKHEADYVHQGLPLSDILPRNFYRGCDLGWAPIAQKLDVRRNLIDSILSEIVLLEETERPSRVELYALKAEAGAGKSVCMKRIAWEAAIDWEKTCIYLKSIVRPRYEPLFEIFCLIRERLFVFIDNAADNAAEIEEIIIRARKDGMLLTIVTAARVNEWNMSCERLDNYVTSHYSLPYMDRKEIENLVDLLETNKSLGHLVLASKEERIEAFVQRAGRQLLVALHEATEGRPFEDILIDEFHEIKPFAAQSLYLSVCVLNSLNVPVRAGLISRVHDVPFSDFKERLFKPLEHVVLVQEDKKTKDYFYYSRHTEIASIVFKRILASQEDKFTEYARLLAALNISYDSDRKAYRQLIRGRMILNLFPSHQIALQIFKIALDMAPDDPYYWHQRGLYEMNRPEGNLSEAYNFLNKAKRDNGKDTRVTHSLAELARVRSEKAKNPLEREKFREEAQKLAKSIISTRTGGSYAHHTLLKVAVERLKEVLTSINPIDLEIENAIQQVEKIIENGLQVCPGDPYLLGTESEFSKLLKDEKRALEALEKAFKVNQRSPFIATRLAKAYRDNGDADRAGEVLAKALDANTGDLRLNFALAKMMIETGEKDIGKILYHLKRSFSPADQNYEAQFWYARYLFVSGLSDSIKDASQLFRKLRETPVSYVLKTAIRDTISEQEVPVVFTGRISRKESTYGVIERDGPSDSIFMHVENLQSSAWNRLSARQRVSFSIGFNFFGPRALNVVPLEVVKN